MVGEEITLFIFPYVNSLSETLCKTLCFLGEKKFPSEKFRRRR